MAWDRSRPLTRIQSVNQKVMVLIPHKGESGYRQWERWWKEGLIKPPGTSHLEQRGLSLTTNRTGLVIEALKSDAEYFFFLDDDIIGPNEMLTTLLSHRLPIACGLYMAKKRKGERGLAAWMKRDGGYAPIAPEQGSRLIQIDVTGLGCALIHRSVFERVSQPWFVWEFGGISEDFFFFEKVYKEMEIKPIIDLAMKCRHIGTFIIDTDDNVTTLEL